MLFIEINPSTVDVNVHPAKLEVKFSNEKPVFEAIYYAVKNALEADTQRPSVSFKGITSPVPTPQRVSDRATPIEDGKRESLAKRQLQSELYVAKVPQKEEKQYVSNVSKQSSSGFEHVTAEEYLAKYLQKGKEAPADTQKAKVVEPSKTEIKETPISKPEVSVPQPRIKPTNIQETSSVAEDAVPVVTTAVKEIPKAVSKKLSWRIIGEAFNSYVLVECEDKLLIVDKHAAHERIIFEELKASMRRQNANASQLLMLPIEVMMTSDEIETLAEYKVEIESVGFEFTTGRYTASVMAIPEGINADAVGDMLTVMAERIKSNTGTALITRDIIFEKALYQAACKAAVKAGREYPPEYVEWIIGKLMELPDITVCPHGRPVAIELTHKKLDYQFERL